MKISPKTISILQNFQTINTSLLFPVGNKLRSVTEGNSIGAMAEVPDHFPKEFAIYELAKFLGILSLDKESELEFHDKYLIVKQSHGNTKYFYCPPEMILRPQGTDVVDVTKDAVIRFELSPDVFNSLTKSSDLLGHQEVAICGKDGVLSIDALNVVAEKKGRDYPNRFVAKIGETNKEFMAVLDRDKLKMIKTVNYTVSVSKKYGLVHFKGKFEDEVPLQYWIALSGTKSDLSRV